MKLQNYIRNIVILLALFIIFVPFIYAENLDLQYDSLGNLITGDGFYRTYDGFNHLVQIRIGNTSSGNITEELTWHPVEERIFVKKEYYFNQSLKAKIVYLNQNTVKVVNSSGTFYETYVYQEGILVAQEINGQKQAIHNDNLDSVSLITNASGGAVEATFMSPHGELISGGKASRYDFTGKEFDSQTQDYDFWARRYNPMWGRFIQPDKLIQDPYNPQALNHYSYSWNNPYGAIDPNGKTVVLVRGGQPSTVGGSGSSSSSSSSSADNDNYYYGIEQSFDQGNPTQVFDTSSSYNDVRDFVDRFQDTDTGIVVVGYSWGGSQALEYAEKLESEGITIDAVITIDPYKGYLIGGDQSQSDLSISGDAYNLFQTNGEYLGINVGLHGQPKGGMFNVDVTRNGVTHNSVIRQSDIQAYVSSVVNAIYRASRDDVKSNWRKHGSYSQKEINRRVTTIMTIGSSKFQQLAKSRGLA